MDLGDLSSELTTNHNLSVFDLSSGSQRPFNLTIEAVTSSWSSSSSMLFVSQQLLDSFPLHWSGSGGVWPRLTHKTVVWI